MIKRLLTAIVLLSICHLAFAQVLDPVSWSWEVKAGPDNTAELIYTATIDDGWNVYSQYTSDEGPVPTSIVYENADGIELIGESVETGKKKSGYDKIFELDVIKFLSDEPYVIKQKVKIKDPSASLSGYLTYMTCDKKRCLPPSDVDFSFDLASSVSKAAPSATSTVSTKVTETTADVKTAIKTVTPAAKATPTKKATSIGNVTMPDSEPSADKTAIVLNTESDQAEEAPPTGNMVAPVVWNLSVQKIDDTTYDLIYQADIEEGWTTYGKDSNIDGPIPTTINYEEMDGIELVGDPVETGHKKVGPEPIFDNVTVIKYLADEAFITKQRVRVTDPSLLVKGYIESMACNDRACTKLPDESFAFDLKGSGKVVPYNTPSTAGAVVPTGDQVDVTRPILKASGQSPLSDCGAGGAEKKDGLIWLLLAGIIGGFAALMTPCVFPMIPITVSFFTKDTKRKGWVNGLIYGLSIILIYVILGLLITVFLGPEALNQLSTSWIANTIFFVIFIVFAFSFFGFYEITLPSSWSTKSDSMADKGGLLGIFFMAATLALVSFSCTGPIVGSALVAAANGGLMGPLVVMFGFSAALALPFGLFAAFPAWLNSLPKSGGWMNSVKVVLGFLEVGFAFKFLSTADLTQHWGILKYETFMLIMILVCIAIALYLFGFIKFPHDSPIKKLSLARKAIGATFAALGIYLMTGFTINDNTGIYNSLWLTSGFSPPVNYNMFLDQQKVDPSLKATYGSVTKGANNITMFKDYEEGLAYAKEVGKPVFIDFTGHGCQNCRRTEDNIWVQDKVRSFLNDSVVLVSLYVDDREALAQPYQSAIDGKKKRNVGSKWADFQVANFSQNSQPLYIMVTPEEEVITHPRPYQAGVDSYLDYLECGIRYYRTM
jgi:thiol:disulfide interchange protein DsbD